MRFGRRKWIIWGICAAFLCAVQALAYDEQGHVRKWEEIFGIDSELSNRTSLDRLWRDAQYVLDRYQDTNAELRRRFPWFDWGRYGHRLLFHWGFNEDPARHEPLVRQAEAAWSAYAEKLRRALDIEPALPPAELWTLYPPLKDVPEELFHDSSPAARMTIWAELDGSVKRKQFDSFWNFLRGVQGRSGSNPESSESSARNRRLIRSVENNMGLSGRPARAMATLIYDIHVLADYDTPRKEALGDISRLKDDVMNMGVRRLVGTSTWSKYKLMFDQLGFYRNDHSEAHAKQLLDLLKEIVPEILGTSPYREILERKGVKLKDAQKNQKEAA